MSKKISLILAIVVAFLGIILVSLFGKVPEYLLPRVNMEKLYFQDENITTKKNGDKVYYFRPTFNNLSINLYDMIVYEPNDTTNIAVSFYLSNNKIAKVTVTGMLTFEEEIVKNNSFTSLEITIYSQDGTNLKDTLTIMNSKYKDNNSESYKDYEF